MQPKYRRVSYEQRCQIKALIETKISRSEISRRIGVHRSTIYRELRRNALAEGGYQPKTANEIAKASYSKCRRTRIFENLENQNFVVQKLHEGLSPEQIKGRYHLCSHQTIYNEIKKYRKDLAPLLRRFRRHGRRGRPAHKPKTLGKWCVPIDQRPKHVESRSEFGHWERDTMYVAKREMVLVAVERKSRFVRITKLPKPLFPNAAKETVKLIKIRKIKPLSITNDRGAEFRGETNIKTPIYFCDPQSPQQRGTIENTIGLLRQYLKLKTNINELTNSDLRKIERRLNDRPRKCLNYLTPNEVLFDLPVALAT